MAGTLACSIALPTLPSAMSDWESSGSSASPFTADSLHSSAARDEFPDDSRAPEDLVLESLSLIRQQREELTKLRERRSIVSVDDNIVLCRTHDVDMVAAPCRRFEKVAIQAA